MAFRFVIQEKLPDAFPRVARERIDHVINSLSEKPKPGGEAVHEARKNLKSLRAVLRLARGVIDKEIRTRENALFRDAGRALSTIRDPQALLEALEHFDRPRRGISRSSTKKQASLHAFIGKIRRDIEKKLIDGLPPETLKTLLKDLREARRRATFWFEKVLLSPENEWQTFVGAGLRQTYRKGRSLVWQFEVMGQEKADDNAWHELRKCAKSLGYQLRLLKPIWPGTLATLMDEIDQLTDRLGDANDLSILRAKILDEPYDPAESLQSSETRRVFLQSIDRRKQKLHAEAFGRARLIYVEKPGQFERRLAGYWHVWRSQYEVKKPGSVSETGGKTSHQMKAVRKAESGIMAASSS
jgi:CHAD domain-containing protein